MAMHLITGHSGTAHISAADDGALNAAIVGEGSYVFGFGDDFAATMTTANSVTIGTGALVHQGRKAWCSTSTQLTVESGTQAQRRHDLVVARYTKTGDVEDMQLAVIRGTPVSYGEPSDPAHEDGSVIDGATVSDFPLWRIPIDGITPGTPVRLFDVTPSLAALRDSVSQKLNDIGVTTVGAQPAADWIFATAIRCPTGVVIGGNVTGNAVSQDSTILTVNLLKEAVPVYLVMRGFFHGHQSAARIEVSGSTLTVRMEQATSFSSGDTFGAFVPLTWA